MDKDRFPRLADPNNSSHITALTIAHAGGKDAAIMNIGVTQYVVNNGNLAFVEARPRKLQLVTVSSIVDLI